MIQFDDNVERQDEVAIRKIKESGLPVVLYGAGEFAEYVEYKLRRRGVADIYKAVDDKSGNTDIYTIDEIDRKLEAYALIPAFVKAVVEYTPDAFEKFKNHKELFYILRNFAGNINVYHMDDTYFQTHRAEFQAVYNDLCDDRSRRSFDAFIKCKITGDVADMHPLVETPAYFSGDFLKFTDHESFVDCGAYDGDSIADFLTATGGRYEHIFAFEPDEDNFAALGTFVHEHDLRNVELVKRGAYDSETELRFFSVAGLGSKINEAGETVIKTDTIDNIVGDRRVTFIKMDIEGAERNALDGAAQTIRRCRPVLAICAYHRIDDLFVLHRIIKDLHVDYSFYFRLHMPTFTDAVLYAVPK